MDRRMAIGTLAGAATLLAAVRPSAAGEKGPEPEAFAPGKQQVVPLPFDPAKIKGLSEKLLVSHHDNNYASAVKNLNAVEQAIAAAGKDTPPWQIAGLRERELTFANSKVLHELYFANLGGDGKPSGAVEKAIAGAFGGFGAWEAQFRAVGLALGGGSGWVTLQWSFALGQLRIAWSGGHTQALAAGVPLLVMDMYEHAYQMDYGAAAAKYVDAFFGAIHWQEVSRRYEAALKAHAALRS